MQTDAALNRYPLFAALGADALAPWLAAGEVRRVEMGESLLEAGAPGRHVYLIRSGKVRVMRSGKSEREVPLGAFGPGEVFGEYALLEPGLNTATCRSAAAGEVLRLPLNLLRDIVLGRGEIHANLKRWLRLHSVLAQLRDRSFLGFMSATSLLQFLERFETARIPAGRAIQAEGLSGDCWFAILEGQVRVESTSSLLGAGDYFGNEALLGRGHLPCAEAVSDVSCTFLRREAFLGMLRTGAGPSMQTWGGLPPRPRDQYPFVAQQGANDCGLASLAMVARFHGLTADLDALRRSHSPGQRGLALTALQQVAAGLGFRGRAIQIGADRLGEVVLPAIAHLSDEHYVAVYALTPEGVIVGDPASGVLTIGLKGFRHLWSGALLLLPPPTGPG